MKRLFVQCVLAAGIVGLSAVGPATAQGFTISSSALQDGGWLQMKNIGNNPKNPNCGGDNTSPPISWTNVPEKATSLALPMSDPGRPRGSWCIALGCLWHSRVADRLC